jgi:hypothetical protein
VTGGPGPPPARRLYHGNVLMCSALGWGVWLMGPHAARAEASHLPPPEGPGSHPKDSTYRHVRAHQLPGPPVDDIVMLPIQMILSSGTADEQEMIAVAAREIGDVGSQTRTFALYSCGEGAGESWHFGPPKICMRLQS